MRNITDLPVEILIKIFNYFPPTYLARTLSLVCKRFLHILSDEEYWKMTYYKLLRSYHQFQSFPLLQSYGLLKDGWRLETDVFWKDLTLRLKRAKDRWSNLENVVKFHCSTETVDVVYLLKDENICITGSRERCVDLWSIDSRAYIKTTIVDAHRGWITCLDSCEKDYFYSGAWDSSVSMWNIGQSSCQSLWTFNCRRPLMAVSAKHGLVVAGIFSQSIVLIDPRIRQEQRSTQFTAHEKPTVSLTLLDNYVISIGRDLKLCVSDLRQLSVVHRVNACQAPPRCLAIKGGIAFVGDIKGFVHLFDMGDSYKKFQQIQVTRNFQVADICPDLGHLIVGCTDHRVRVIVPTKPFYVLKELDVEHEITTMSLQNKMLAVGKVNGAIDVFKPNLSNL